MRPMNIKPDEDVIFEDPSTRPFMVLKILTRKLSRTQWLLNKQNPIFANSLTSGIVSDSLILYKTPG